MKKLIGLFAFVLAGLLLPANVAGSSPSGSQHVCVGEISGFTATSNGRCILLVHKYKDGTAPKDYDHAWPQTLVGRDGGDKTSLSVKNPGCAYQIDLVDDTAQVKETLNVGDEAYYTSHGWLVAAEHGGTSACKTTPPVVTPPVQKPTEIGAPVEISKPAVAVETQPQFTG